MRFKWTVLMWRIYLVMLVSLPSSYLFVVVSSSSVSLSEDALKVRENSSLKIEFQK